MQTKFFVVCLSSIRPNIFVGRVDGSATYQKWYFEVTMDHIEQTTHMMPHLRVSSQLSMTIFSMTSIDVTNTSLQSIPT